MKTRIVIFAKAPQAGFAKTRLIPALGAQGAAHLAQRLLTHTLDTALAAQVGPVELCMTPAPTHAMWESFPILQNRPIDCSDQGVGDLGERMARAAARVIQAKEAILLIGTDCPELSPTHLHQAAQALQQTDATMIPVTDGGYVLLGLRQFHPTVFDSIAWSTSAVARQTRERLARLAWSVTSFPALHDIDTQEDIRHVPKRFLYNLTGDFHESQNLS